MSNHIITYRATATPFIIASPLLHTCLVRLSDAPLRHLLIAICEFWLNKAYNAKMPEQRLRTRYIVSPVA